MNCERRENRTGCVDAPRLRTRPRADASTAALGTPMDSRARRRRCRERRREFHEYFSGEGVAPHVEIGDLDRELVGVVTSSETDEEPPKYLETVAVGGSAHVDTLRNGPRR
jgi:hypothetical protein